MRVGLNCVFLVPGETGGMETYAHALAPRLAAFGIEPIAFVSRAAAGADLGVEQVVVGVDARSRVQWVLGEQLLLPRLARRAGCELVHSLASTGPVRGRFARVTTVHDLTYRTVPEAHSRGRAAGMSLLVPAAARRSRRVIVSSESTRADVVRYIGLPSERVDVVPLGVGEPAATATDAGDLRGRFGLGDRPVVLSTGGTRPHKNVARLAAALRDVDATLVVTGYATPSDDALVAAGVVRTGHVSQADLEGLYRLATVVCAPSLAEGFGLPVLEAMARGVPVACSATGALAEVAGDAAQTFDPTSVDAIRAALTAVLGDAGLRERLVVAGRARAAQFTWERTAQLTVDAYARA